MKVFIGSDHAGFELKEFLKKYFEHAGISYVDCGNVVFDKNDDYPDYATRVAKSVVADGDDARGVLICDSGVGVSIVANKVMGIRAALVSNEGQAKSARAHNNANIVCLGQKYISEGNAKKIVDSFLQTNFSSETRHKRRVSKIDSLNA